jgi:hypothetical protein
MRPPTGDNAGQVGGLYHYRIIRCHHPNLLRLSREEHREHVGRLRLAPRRVRFDHRPDGKYLL